jgi:hypothetical protein
MKSKKVSWTGHVARMIDKRTAYMLLIRDPEGKRTQEIPRSKWLVNIIMDFGQIGSGGTDWD